MRNLIEEDTGGRTPRYAAECPHFFVRKKRAADAEFYPGILCNSPCEAALRYPMLFPLYV